MLFLNHLAVADNVNRNIRAYKSKNVKVYIHVAVDFDNILFAHFSAWDISQNSHRTIKVIKVKQAINLHSLAVCNMLDYDAVFNRVNSHLLHLQKLQNKRHTDKFDVFSLFKIASALIVVNRGCDLVNSRQGV